MPRPRAQQNDDHPAGTPAPTPSGTPHGVLGDQYARGDCWVVEARGDLDIDSLAPLQEALEEAAASRPVIVLDASAVTFGDSGFLNLLLRLHAAASLRIAAPPQQLRRLFQLTGADQVLRIDDSVPEAAGA